MLTLWTLKYVDCVSYPFIDYFHIIQNSQSSQLILKNLILGFPKNMIKTSLSWSMYLALQANFGIMLRLMKSSSFVPLLNILHKNL